MVDNRSDSNNEEDSDKSKFFYQIISTLET